MIETDSSLFEMAAIKVWRSIHNWIFISLIMNQPVRVAARWRSMKEYPGQWKNIQVNERISNQNNVYF